MLLVCPDDALSMVADQICKKLEMNPASQSWATNDTKSITCAITSKMAIHASNKLIPYMDIPHA